MFTALNSTSTASITKTLQSWFNVLGWPRSIRSDGGPQFHGEFLTFCDKFGIKHDLASPYNGLAESGVKIVQNMLHRCMGKGKDIQQVLYEWRNMLKQHGYSPSPDSEADKLRDECSGCTGSRPRRQRTPSKSQLVDSRSSIFNGLHLPLGQQQSLSVRCFSSLSSSAAGSVPAISTRAWPVMASSSTSSGPLLSAPLSPCRSQELLPARSSPQRNPARPSLFQPLTQTQQGGHGLPPVGPPFPRPTPPTIDNSPGCHTRPFSTMEATSTNASASAAFWVAAGIPFSTAPDLVLTTISERIAAASLSWICPRGHVEPPLAACPSGSPSPLSQQSATGLKGRSPARPLDPRLPAPGGIPCRPLQSMLVSTLSRRSSSTVRPPGQGSMSTPPSEERKVIPSASLKDYNSSVSSPPGSVYGLRVHF